tara:strand:- start:4207 stop:5589 length:1383 start_codon:yes stop_codon:yes gene_type:complete
MLGNSSQQVAQMLQSMKKGSVGYQTPLVPAGGSQTAQNLSPLVPQQLAQTLSVATSTMQDLKLFPMLSKVMASNTVVEYNRVLNHGAEHSPFIAEGGLAPLNRSTYEKVAVQIKYLAERREITDQATLLNLVGGTPDALAEETRRGTEALLRRLEKELFHGDSSVNPLSWDGMIKQISDGGNVADLRGASLTANYLAEILGTLYSAPFYGMATHILVTPRVLSKLIQDTTSGGRHDQLAIRESSRFVYGSRSIYITAPYGEVEVVACPFLERHDRNAPALNSPAVYGSIAVDDNISIGNISTPVDATSKFNTADHAGNYYYRVVPVGAGGVGKAQDSIAIAVANGDNVTFDITSDTTVSHFRIYRSAVDATDANKALLIREIARSGNVTTFIDRNEKIGGTSDVLVINNSPEYNCYYQMLSLTRRQLAQTSTSLPFLLMMFGAPAVKLPSKQYIISNVGS